MGFQINTNLPSLIAQDNLRLTSDFQQKTITRVTSGLRITQSGDDAAGLAIANGFRSDIAVLTQGVRNANDGLSTLQIIDGGINNISKLLDRARTLATQSASGTFTGSRNVLSSEFQSVLTEINRQAQAIGLDTGGSFAKNLQVFIGGGRANGGVDAINNGSVSVNLGSSTVDAQSLGLKGVQVKGVTGTDIGTGSASTKVSDILANTINTASVATGGVTEFMFYGPGFGGKDGVKVSVTTAGVTDVDTLAAAVNSAIANAGNGTTQAATAFKNAGIVASVNTDANGAKQLTFTSAAAAFQVEAGDRLANAFLGNFERNAVATSTDTAATIATNGGGTANRLTLAVDGGSAFNVDVTASATLSKGALVNELNANGTFSASATAYLDGNKVVIRSKGNSATSAVTVTTTTLSTNLGLSSATAAAASTGADVATRVQASTATAAGATTFGAAGAGTIRFRVSGGNLASPVDLSLDVTAATTVTQALASLQTAVSDNTQLADARISLTSSSAANSLVFTSKGGERFQVDVTGDSRNLLGFGSFVTGANNAVDYATIQSVTYNEATSAAGTDATLEFSIAGGASSTNSVTVDLTAGDATAASVASTDTSTGIVNITGNNNKLNLLVNGTAVNVTLTIGASTKNDIANQINTALGANGSATVVGNAITITSATKGRGGSIQVLSGTGNTTLGFATSTSPTFGSTSRSGQSVADALNTAFAADAQLQAAGLTATFANNKITITSANDTYFRVNARGSATAASVVGSASDTVAATAGKSTVANAGPYAVVAGASDQFKIKVDGGAQVEITISAGAALTAAQIAADLNNGKLSAAIVGGSGATASVDATGHLVITSNTTGAASSVVLAAGTNDALAVLGAGTSVGGAAAQASQLVIGAASNKLRIAVDGGSTVDVTLTNTAGDTAANVAADAQTQINAALLAAGQSATVTVTAQSNGIKITSASTGSGSSIAFSTITNDAYTALGLTSGVTTTGRESNVGFGIVGATFTGNTVSAAPATSARIDAGGSTQTAGLAFNVLQYGNDDQSITITANDTNGAAQSKTIVLQNDATNRSGRTIDEAVNAINTALQQTNNSTLQKVVAVKDNSSGTEQIRFLSTLSSFKVAVGSVPNSGDGIGSAGSTVDATAAEGGNNIDISSQATAQQAVTALAAAVAKLGDAQAVVGRGQNQFNYAVNLAQSQLTNIAAAESRIRDADLAAEAANLTKAQIVLQAGVAALAQANSAPQAVLALLRG